MGRLALEGVTKQYDAVVAVEDVSLEIDDAGLHCLLGPNGSGKTTMLRMLAGLERPTSGTVHREGVDPGCGFQRPSFYPSLSVRENLAVFGAMLDAHDEDWRDRLVERLGLSPALHRQAGDLSGGFARKLDLALAFLARPSVVLLDEPLGALDDVSRERFVAFLADYCDAGNAVVVSTHQVTTFEAVLDRLTVVHDGRPLDDRRREAFDLAEGESLQERYLALVRQDGGPGGVEAADAE